MALTTKYMIDAKFVSQRSVPVVQVRQDWLLLVTTVYYIYISTTYSCRRLAPYKTPPKKKNSSRIKDLAYVLTLLPGRVFQVFQVVEEEKERENRECIDNLFKFIISIHICSNASPLLNITIVSLISSWFPESDVLTRPDDKSGDISVESQDMANRNQDDIHHVLCRLARKNILLYQRSLGQFIACNSISVKYVTWFVGLIYLSFFLNIFIHAHG